MRGQGERSSDEYHGSNGRVEEGGTERGNHKKLEPGSGRDDSGYPREGSFWMNMSTEVTGRHGNYREDSSIHQWRTIGTPKPRF